LLQKGAKKDLGYTATQSEDILNKNSAPFSETKPKFDPTGANMIRKLKSGQYRLYSRKKDPKTGKRKNLGTFDSRAAAEKHEREVQYFKRAG
jgi:hypothetical protein